MLFIAVVTRCFRETLEMLQRAAEGKRGREAAASSGVAVLASLFSHYGGYRTGATFVDGMTPAVYVGAAIVAAGCLAAFAIKRRPKGEAVEAETAFELAA